MKGVEEFHGLLTDVGAQKGAMVCPKGFSKTAKKRARGLQIDLFSPVDTNPHKWQVHVSVPVVCDFRGVHIGFGLRMSAPLPFRTAYDFYETLPVHDHNGQLLGLPIEVAERKWNEGQFPIEPGEHEHIAVFGQDEVFVDNGYGQRVPVEIYAHLLVERQLYFGNLPVSKMSGFKDELSGNVITNAFEIGIFDHQEVVNNWQRINGVEDLPVPPLLQIRGLWSWGGRVA